jgi:hypothetical protein
MECLAMVIEGCPGAKLELGGRRQTPSGIL